MEKVLVFAVGYILINSCSPPIRYDTRDISHGYEDNLRKIVISLYVEGDIRREESCYKHVLFTISSDNKTACFNLEKGYGRKYDAQEIGLLAVEHFKAKRNFKRVLWNQADSADLSISPTLKSSYGTTHIDHH